MMDSEEMVCEQCSAKLTGEEGMMICLPCQGCDEEDYDFFNDGGEE